MKIDSYTYNSHFIDFEHFYFYLKIMIQNQLYIFILYIYYKEEILEKRDLFLLFLLIK